MPILPPQRQSRIARSHSVLTSDSSDFEANRPMSSQDHLSKPRRVSKRVASSSQAPASSNDTASPEPPTVPHKASSIPVTAPPPTSHTTSRGTESAEKHPTPGTSHGPSTQEESDTQSDGEPMGAGPGPFSEDVAEELVNQARYLVNLERQSDIQRAAIEKLIEEVGRLKLAVDHLTAIGRNGICGVLDSESGEMYLEPYDTCPARRVGDHRDRVRGSRRSGELCGMFTTKRKPCENLKSTCPARLQNRHPPQPPGWGVESDASQ
ncbi:hypothetical protein LEN26_012745 [Aphanomyces euteiches]|nr:hypothetical protein LEN26_012745 [Aphanomyces euteiches]